MSEADPEEEVRAAVTRLLEHYEFNEGVLTELGVICALQYFDDDGEPHTTVCAVWPDAPPHYRQLGLLDYVATRVRKQIRDAVEDD